MHTYSNLGPRTTVTPQTEAIPGTMQTPNNAGGFSWSVDDWTRLSRFLCLGSIGGTYYVGERQLSKQNLDVVERLLKAGEGTKVVEKIVEISDAGRAVSNDPALFALARCTSADDVAVRRLALAALPKVARTGTHLLHFVHFCKQFRGWGPVYKRAVADWFQSKDASQLAYQVVKYQQRDGYAQRDLLRLSHPKAIDQEHQALYHWMTKGWDALPDSVPAEAAMRLVWAFERAKRKEDAEEIAELIHLYRMPREAVPTTALHSIKVWEALLEEMPMEAMTRNLATMTKHGVLVPMGAMTTKVIGRLRSQEAIQKARLHPIKLLAALTTYSSGKSVRGDSTWTPLREIIDALNDAFYLAFANVIPTGKRILIAVDVSGSMHNTLLNGIPGMQCHTAAGALAMVIARTEQNWHVMAFDERPHALTISPTQRLDDVVRTITSAGNGGTDCAVPFAYAIQQNLDVDAILTISDSESWFGKGGHPTQILTQYRQKVGHTVRAINIQMTATHVTNNDPNDADALECIGFDTNVPDVIHSFLVGNI